MAAVVVQEGGAAVEKPEFFPAVRSKAVINYGDEAAVRSKELFEGYGLPNGLLNVKEVEEGGWVEETGFVWLVLKQAQKHRFEKAERDSSYDEVITCTISHKRMTDIQGVKAKELGLWVPVNEIIVEDDNSSKVTFKSIMGISRSFPFSHFQL